MFEDSKLTVIDNEGNEVDLEILFTYADDDEAKQYVFCFNEEVEDENGDTIILVYRYDEIGNLEEIPEENEEEWAMLSDVLENYLEDMETGEL